MAMPSIMERIAPAGLIALSFVPMAAGTFRLVQIGGGAEISPEDARFLAAPLPAVLHITSSVIFCILGAFQFVPGFRHRRPYWHRIAGRMVVLCGLTSALSGLWMTQYYPPVEFDGAVLYGIRMGVGSAMTLFLCLGFMSARQRDWEAHRAWMLRGYALGLGAGTQVFTHIPWFIFPSLQGELARTLFMASGWLINATIAERLIMRKHRVAAEPAVVR